MNEDAIRLRFTVNGDDFSVAGESSTNVKKILRQVGMSPETIRRVAIAMYEAEINMVIHAQGGTIDVEITPERVFARLSDTGCGIPDIDAAMREGFSTASHKVRELGFGAGMGLPNIKKYTDKLRITSAVDVGTTVEMEIFNK